MRASLERADTAWVEQKDAKCCYARVADPAGVPWEAFQTLEEVPVHGDDIALANGELCPCRGPDESKRERTAA